MRKESIWLILVLLLFMGAVIGLLFGKDMMGLVRSKMAHELDRQVFGPSEKTSLRERFKFVTASMSGDHEIEYVDDKFIFSPGDLSVRWEGFFVKFTDGDKVLVYNDDPNRNPHNLKNLREHFQAIERGVGMVRFDEVTEGHISMFPIGTAGFVSRRVVMEEDGAREETSPINSMRVKMVQMDHLTFRNVTLRIPSKKIISIGATAMTSGGSVYIFPIEIRDQAAIYVWNGTRSEENLIKLERLAADIQEHLIQEPFTLVVKNPSFVDQISVVEMPRDIQDDRERKVENFNRQTSPVPWQEIPPSRRLAKPHTAWSGWTVPIQDVSMEER